MAEGRVRTAVALLVLLVGLVGLVVPTGRVAAGAAQTAAGALELRGQTTWWLPEQPFSLTLGIDAPSTEQLEVAVSVLRKIPNRTGFAATTAGRGLGRPIDEIPPMPVESLSQDERGDRVLTFTPSLRTTGVYPLQVELRPVGASTEDALDRFVTYLVHAPGDLPGGELAVAVVVPAHAPPAVQPDGSVAIDDQRAEQLAELAGALAAHPQLALTLSPTPETVEALGASPRDEDRGTLSTLVRAAAGDQVLGGPYVPTNLTSVLQAGLEEESAGQLTRGVEALGRLFELAPSTDVRLVDERLTDEALGFLQSAQQVRRLVIPEELLEPVDRRTTLTSPFEVQAGDTMAPAAAADAGLAVHFGVENPVLGAQRLLADLAVIYNDDPAAAGRGVVVSPPRTWSPSGAFTETLLDGLADSPVLADVTVDGLFDSVPPATTGTGRRTAPLVRRMAPAPAGTAIAPALPGSTVEAARRRIDAFASAVEPGNPLLDRFDRTLLAAQSADLRARQRARYLEGVRDQVQAEIDRIAMPQNRSITLTAREGEIPVTITSNAGYPVKAVLRLVSDTLEFPQGASQDLDLVRRNTTSQFTVRAQSSGSFPLRVRLESPDGLVLAESRFTVRSTAISGVGTALSIGTALFLLVWWGNHLRGRRSRRLVGSSAK